MPKESQSEVGTPPPRKGDPCVVVIFGASGDLTHRKLIPALFNLQREGYLSDDLAVLGTARTPMEDAEFRKRGRPVGKVMSEPGAEEAWNRLAERIFYIPGGATDPAFYEQLKAKLAELD